MGVEPTQNCFADSCLSHSVHGHIELVVMDGNAPSYRAYETRVLLLNYMTGINRKWFWMTADFTGLSTHTVGVWWESNPRMAVLLHFGLRHTS